MTHTLSLLFPGRGAERFVRKAILRCDSRPRRGLRGTLIITASVADRVVINMHMRVSASRSDFGSIAVVHLSLQWLRPLVDSRCTSPHPLRRVLQIQAMT